MYIKSLNFVSKFKTLINIELSVFSIIFKNLISKLTFKLSINLCSKSVFKWEKFFDFIISEVSSFSLLCNILFKWIIKNINLFFILVLSSMSFSIFFIISENKFKCSVSSAENLNNKRFLYLNSFSEL